MNIADAAYHTVHDYPGGPAALAVRLGKAATTLRHEVRPPAGSTAKLGLVDAQRIMALAGDLRILHAMAAEHGQFLVPLPEVVCDDEATAQQLATLAREFGDVLGTVAQAMADGRVSDNELRAVERQWGELVSAGQHLLQHFARINAAGKPVALREVA